MQIKFMWIVIQKIYCESKLFFTESKQGSSVSVIQIVHYLLLYFLLFSKFIIIPNHALPISSYN